MTTKMLSAHKTSIPCSWKSCYRKTWKAGVEAAVYMRCWWSLTIFFFFGSGQQALGEGGERRKDFFHFEAERGNKLRDWKVLAPLHWECHGWWWWACMFSGRMMYKGQIIWLVLCQQLYLSISVSGGQLVIKVHVPESYLAYFCNNCEF